jgi:hypothetical protein
MEVYSRSERCHATNVHNHSQRQSGVHVENEEVCPVIVSSLAKQVLTTVLLLL